MKKNIQLIFILICGIALGIFGLFIITFLAITETNKINQILESKTKECELLQIQIEQLQNDNRDLSNELLGYQDIVMIQQDVINQDKSELLPIFESLKDSNPYLYLEIYKKLIPSIDTLENTFTDEQIELMYRCIETETYGASLQGKINVASVILNRVKSNTFPPDPIEIITAPNQFAYSKRNISEETKIGLEYAFYFGSEVDDCIAFRSDKCPQTWGKWEYQLTDEIGHHFYK